MSASGNPIRQLGKQNKVVLVSVLGSVLFLSTLTPVLNIPILPSFLLPAATATQHAPGDASEDKGKFRLEEATIEDIHNAIKSGEITATDLVHMYLERIKAYNGQCVEYPDGFLGPTVTPIPNAGKVNAYLTLNLRPDTMAELGFDNPRLARSMTDPVDNNPNMPDALEVAAALDEHFAETGELVGPMHGIPIAIKDQVDTFDMRTTSAADAFYSNDRPPKDATVVAKLREAGAIIIGKANAGTYASSSRSDWGGQQCNPYDTTRTPSGSSGGSGVIPAANLAVCALAEDTGGSIRGPASHNSVVGLRPSIGLNSNGGLFYASLTRDTIGPICRTVMDTATVEDVMKGYDPRDPTTAKSVGQLPDEPFSSFAKEKRLDGVRIGVIRDELEERNLADREVLRLVGVAINDLRGLGAEIVDVNVKDAAAQHVPYLESSFLVNHFPSAFPEDRDQIDVLVDMFFDPSLVPDDLTLFSLFNATGGDGERKYVMNRYLQDRGDANITSTADLIVKSNTFRPAQLEGFDEPTTLANDERLLRIGTLKQLMLIVMAENDLDAMLYKGNRLPVRVIGAPGSGVFGAPDAPIPSLSISSLSPITGFPALDLPAGFSEVAYEWEPDPSDPSKFVEVLHEDVHMPIAIELLARPFDEATLFKIASAYEAATQHRIPPPDFSGPLPEVHMSSNTASAGYGVYDIKPARAQYVTEESELVGDKIDSITLQLKRVHTVEGTAEIGILNEDLSVKKLFGTLDVSNLTTTYTDYEFNLTDGELYTIEAGDRIGIKYDGSSGSNWVSVMLDLDPEDPFDGANSYLQYHYQDSWRHSPDRDMYMILKQTEPGNNVITSPQPQP